MKKRLISLVIVVELIMTMCTPALAYHFTDDYKVQSVQVNSPISGSAYITNIRYPDTTTNCYAFTLTEPGSVAPELVAVTDNSQAYGGYTEDYGNYWETKLLDANGSELDSFISFDWSTGSAGKTMGKAKTLESGTYYVLVSNCAISGSYTLTIKYLKSESMPTPTPAPTPSPAPVPPAAGGDYYVLGTNKLSYTAGEEIVIEYAGFGVNGAEVPGAFLILYRHDSSGITPITGAGLSGIRTTTSDGAYYTWSFGTKDLKQGNYTVCICTNSEDPVSTALISYDVYIATSALPSAAPVPNTPNQPATNHTGTPDGASSWAYDEVSKAISLGFVPSELQKNYQTNITRQEFCNMIIQMLKAKSGGLENDASFLNHFGVVIGESAFSDTTNRNVNIAYELQIVNGTGNRKFAPDGFITRQEAAAMLTNAAKVFEFTTFEGAPVQFADMDTVAVWARGGVNFVSATGIMNGTGSNQFVPMEKYTREQAITTMLRLFNAFPRDYYAL